MFDHNERMRRHAQMSDMLNDLDPLEFVSQRNQLDQAEKIQQVEDYVTGLNKNSYGKLSNEDLLNIQFQVKEFDRWQSDLTKKQDMFFTEYEAYQNNPGEYKPEAFVAGMDLYVREGIMPPEGILKIAGTDPFAFYGNVTLWNPKKPTTNTLYSTKGDIETYDVSVSYGTGDPELDKSMRRQKVMSDYGNNYKVRQGITDAFDNLDPAIQAQYSGIATKKEAVHDPDSGQPKMDKYLLWALDTFPQMIQKTTHSTGEGPVAGLAGIKAARIRANTKEGEVDVLSEGDAQQFTRQRIVGGKLMDVTYDSQTTSTINPKKIPKGQEFTMGDDTFITASPDNKNISGFSAKSAKVQGSWEIEQGFIEEDMPVYIGKVPFETNKVFRGGSALGVPFGRKKTNVEPNEPLSTEMFEALKEKMTDEEFKLNVDSLDVARAQLKSAAYGTMEVMEIWNNNTRGKFGLPVIPNLNAPIPEPTTEPKPGDSGTIEVSLSAYNEAKGTSVQTKEELRAFLGNKYTIID